MSELKLSDLTNINIGLYIVGAFTLFTSVIGITNIAINYSNINSTNENTKLLRENILNISQSIEMKQYNFDKKIIHLESKFNKLLEIQQDYFDEIIDLHIERKNYISKSTSISSLSDDIDKNLLQTNEHHIKYEETTSDEENEEECIDKDDDELLNECYDSLPLHNFKKNTALNWLF
jgi:hypothetical protein